MDSSKHMQTFKIDDPDVHSCIQILTQANEDKSMLRMRDRQLCSVHVDGLDVDKCLDRNIQMIMHTG